MAGFSAGTTTERVEGIAAGTTTERVEGSADSEETDKCVGQSEEVEVGLVKEGKPSLQNVLYVITKAELTDALPEAMKVIQLAVTTPLTGVHCERVVSRMKRTVSNTRVSMRQERKEMLIFLQVEHKLLRSLAKRNAFKYSVINSVKSYNRRRFDCFSSK